MEFYSYEVLAMVKQEDIVKHEVKHELVYKLLPKPQTEQQVTEILDWIKDDREKVFAHILSLKRLDFIRDILIIFIVIALCIVAYYFQQNTNLIFTIIPTLAGLFGLKRYTDKKKKSNDD
jgi:hypothetical protein